MQTYTHNLIRNTFYFALVVLLAFSFAPFAAHADGHALGVVFNPNPLFSESSFLPGDTTSGTVTVTNSSDSEQSVYVEAVNGNDNDGLGGMLHITVTGGGDTLYTGMVHDFLVTGPIALGALGARGNKEYVFDIAFTGDDNAYQESTLGFDLCVGFAGGDLNCGDTVVSPEVPGGGGGGSGGGGGTTSGVLLLIDNERVISLSPAVGTALIGWETNLLATSQVIYGPASGTYTLDLNNLPYFGYPFGTPEVTTKTTLHAIDIADLVPGETYKYRVVSRASPPTISPEYTFVFPGEKVTQIAFATEPGEGGLSRGARAGDSEGTSTEEVLTEGDAKEGDANNNLAALGALPRGLLGFLDSYKCISYALLILLVIFLAWIAFDKWKGYKHKLSREECASRRNMFLMIGTLAAVFVVIVFGKFCLLIPLLVALLLLVLWSLFTPKDGKDAVVNSH